MSDPFVGQLVFFRVYSGMVEAGSYIYNPRTGNKERLSRIVRMQADQREEVKKVFAGEIAAAVGLKDTKTSDTLCDEGSLFCSTVLNSQSRLSTFALNQRQRPTRKKWALHSTASLMKTRH